MTVFEYLMVSGYSKLKITFGIINYTVFADIYSLTTGITKTVNIGEGSVREISDELISEMIEDGWIIESQKELLQFA